MSASTSKSPPPSGPLWAVGSGQALRLGTELGRGGEGTVVTLADRPGQVVKLYHETPSAHKVAKLTALVAASGPAVQKVAAWPQELVRNAAGEIVGFLMPRLAERRDIHQLYSPRSRAAAFPTADFRFIVHVAANIARAFAVLHAQGHVVGDVNHASIVVNPDGTVQLIDCDSFQVRDEAEVFTCDVGVPLFTAPELHGKAFRELVRTPNHDQFGLAVVLFHLLCVGRHPFAGRFLGSGEMPIERAIAEFRFAYGPEAATRQMAPPPGTLPLEALGSEIAGLFGAAFAAKAIAEARPTAADWVGALDRLSAALTACERLTTHHFPPVASGALVASCPWCVLEGQTGLRLFGQRVHSGVGAGAVDVGQLWAAIEAVPLPPPAPLLPGERPVPPEVPPVPLAVRWGAAATMSLVVVLLMVLVTVIITYAGPKLALMALSIGGGILISLLQHNKWRSADDQACATAKSHWEMALAMWRKQEAQDVLLAARRVELEQSLVALNSMATERQKRLNQLEKERFERQRERYLDHFYLESATINRIGTSRKAMLLSFGIETAADVVATRIHQIPGFGVALTEELVNWRRQLEHRFHPNPHEPLNPLDIVAMDQALATLRQQLLATLRNGPAELSRLSQEINAGRARVLPLLDKAWIAWQYAEKCRAAH